MRSIILGTLLLVSLRAHSQFISAELGVDGLTCSMCARSVEMSIRRLPFVKEVTVDLRATTMKVEFKRAAGDIEKLASSVMTPGSPSDLSGHPTSSTICLRRRCLLHSGWSIVRFCRNGQEDP
jgi:copper chaperone CopZ